MLFFDAKNSPTLGYSQPTPQQASKAFLPEYGKLPFAAFGALDLPPADENAVLPEGGKAILDAAETSPVQKSPEAQALIEGLLTADCKAAIRDASLNKYAVGMLDLIAMDKKAKQKSLNTFTSQLRAWPAAVQAYWLATNERDNDDNRAGVSDLQSAALSKVTDDCKYANDLTKLVQQTNDVKAAEVVLFKAQLINAGGKFPLSEFHPLEKNAKGIYWYGAVCVRERVAALKQVDDKKTGIKFVYIYPIPEMQLWYEKGEQNNPEYYAAMPCYTDYLPWSFYGMNGTEMDTTEWDTYWGEATGSWAWFGSPGPELPVYASQVIFDDFLAEQAKRMYDADVEAFVPDKYLGSGKVVPKETVTMQPTCGLGWFIAVGRSLDPEWGGTESENLVVNHTTQEVYNAILPELRKRQDQRRIALKKSGKFGGDTEAGEYYVLCNKIRKVEEAVSTAALLPPVRTKWKPAADLKKTFADWQKMMRDSTGVY